MTFSRLHAALLATMLLGDAVAKLMINAALFLPIRQLG